MTNQQEISRRILALVAAGSTVQQAFDAILGAGAYARLASDLYDQFRVRVV